MGHVAAAIQRPTSLMVTSFSFESRPYEPRFWTNGSSASAAWGTANRAIYVPVLLRQPSTFVKAFWANGATASGNVDVGVYDVAWTRIASTGSTAQSGTSVLQEVNITDFTLSPGRYYLAIASSSATATFIAQTMTDDDRLPGYGYASEESALPLPATATPAVIAHLVVPVFGFSRRTLVA